MLIGKKEYYFLKVLLFFAFSKKESFPIKEISKRLDISEKVLEQVLLSLKNRGILSSKRGPRGGYRLLADVSGMTVMDILEMTGKKPGILPVDTGRKRKVIDTVLGDLAKDMESEITAKFKKLKLKDMVGLMKEKVTEKGLSYSI